MFKISENVSLSEEQLIEKNGNFFARLVCTKPFICKTMLIAEGKKGGFVEVKLNNNVENSFDNFSTYMFNVFNSKKINIEKPLVEIGEKTWIETYDMAGATIIQKNSKIGSEVLMGPGCKVGKNVLIEDNCHILYGTKIQNNVQIGENSTIGGLSIIFANTFIKANCTLGDNVYVGYPKNYYDKYWRTINFDRKTQNFSPKSTFTKTKNKVLGIIQDKFYAQKSTYVGENVNIGRHTKIYKKANLGNNVKVGILSDIKCELPHNFVAQDKEILEK